VEGVKVTVHPLFVAVIIFCAFYGGFLIAIIAVLTALLHECGHIFCAAKMGFKCEKLRLMPYGASAVCDLDGIRLKDEIVLALAGPKVNLLICVFCAGLWWFLPQTYAFTDTVMYMSLAMLVVNLLPAYPLDGGRVVHALLVKRFSEKVASITLKVSAFVIAATLVVLFFVFGYNLTCLTFAGFLVCSAFEKVPTAVKINFSAKGKLKRVLEVKYVAVDKDLTYMDAIKLLDDKRYLVLQMYDDGFLTELTQDELYDAMQLHSLTSKVFD
jgi:stage IV sporulation protein FB